MKVDEALNNFIDTIDNHEITKQLKTKRALIMNNRLLMNEMRQLKEMDHKTYLKTKIKLFEHEDVMLYHQLLNEFNLLLININRKLASINKQATCNKVNHENY